MMGKKRKPERREPVCSFCGGDQNAVSRMIKSSDDEIYICSECVLLCMEILINRKSLDIDVLGDLSTLIIKNYRDHKRVGGIDAAGGRWQGL